MSDSSISLQSPVLAAAGQGYSLSDDLAKLCLPQEFRDSYRRVAWVDSVCLLFLVVGLIGLKAPKVVERPLSAPVDNTPVLLPPPEEQPKPMEVKPDEQEPPPDQTAADTPQIAPVVAALNSPAVAFSVPVEGAVAIAPSVQFAPPPPPVTKAPAPKPKIFIPGRGESGHFPQPSYPREAQDQRIQGDVMLLVAVDTNGLPQKVEVKDTSNHYVLDQCAMQCVKRNWRWPPGEARSWYVPFQFKLQ
jgi:protein TonB